MDAPVWYKYLCYNALGLYDTFTILTAWLTDGGDISTAHMVFSTSKHTTITDEYIQVQYDGRSDTSVE